MTKNTLQNLAGIIWIGIGLKLCYRGYTYLNVAHESGSSSMAIGIAVALGLIFGGAKGKFVLSKSALRNKKRITELEGPVRPWQVFAYKFYPLIAVMIGMGIGLRFFFAKGHLGGMLTYGGLVTGIGAALFVSAFAYWFPAAFEKKVKADAEVAAGEKAEESAVVEPAAS